MKVQRLAVKPKKYSIDKDKKVLNKLRLYWVTILGNTFKFLDYLLCLKVFKIENPNRILKHLPYVYIGAYISVVALWCIRVWSAEIGTADIVIKLMLSIMKSVCNFGYIVVFTFVFLKNNKKIDAIEHNVSNIVRNIEYLRKDSTKFVCLSLCALCLGFWVALMLSASGVGINFNINFFASVVVQVALTRLVMILVKVHDALGHINDSFADIDMQALVVNELTLSGAKDAKLMLMKGLARSFGEIHVELENFNRCFGFVLLVALVGTAFKIYVLVMNLMSLWSKLLCPLLGSVICELLKLYVMILVNSKIQRQVEKRKRSNAELLSEGNTPEITSELNAFIYKLENRDFSVVATGEFRFEYGLILGLISGVATNTTLATQIPVPHYV